VILSNSSTLHFASSFVGGRLCGLLILLAVLIAFEPVRHNELVWDDQQNLILNHGWRGIDAAHLRWMFTTFHGGHYQPLTWLSFAIGYELFGGLNPTAIHLTNVVIHAANALLVFALSRRVLRMVIPETGDRVNVGALFAALMFAVHPLRVESVAWATERRDVLSTFWLLVATLLYLRFARNEVSGDIAVNPKTLTPTPLPKRERGLRATARDRGLCNSHPGISRTKTAIAFTASLVCYGNSLLCKASGMTFPLVLLVLDWYPLRRSIRRRVLAEKIVFAIPALAAAIVALVAQKSSGALQGFASDSQGVGAALLMRLTRAAYGVVFYVWKTLIPVELSPLYELKPMESISDPTYLSCATVVVLAAAICLIFRKRLPSLVTALSLYLILLLPVLGLAQSGPQLVADRYSYLGCIPIAVLVGGILLGALQKSRAVGFLRIVIPVSCVVAIVGMIAETRAQVFVWRGGYSLWNTVVERQPNSGLGHANFAIELNQRGEYESARVESKRALQILPGNLAAHTALGKASLALGDFSTAKEHLLAALEIRQHIQKPDASTLAALGVTYSKLGDSTRAEERLKSAIELEPRNAYWSIDLAELYGNQKRSEDARRVLLDFLSIEPAHPDVWLRLGKIEQESDRPAAAIEIWKTGLTYSPNDVDLQAMVAWVLATTRADKIRDAQRALTLADSVIHDSGGQCIRAIEAKAAALADLGRFDEAIETLSTLLNESNGKISSPISERIRGEIKRYEAKSQVRE